MVHTNAIQRNTAQHKQYSIQTSVETTTYHKTNAGQSCAEPGDDKPAESRQRMYVKLQIEQARQVASARRMLTTDIPCSNGEYNGQQRTGRKSTCQPWFTQTQQQSNYQRLLTNECVIQNRRSGLPQHSATCERLLTHQADRSVECAQLHHSCQCHASA